MARVSLTINHTFAMNDSFKETGFVSQENIDEVQSEEDPLSFFDDVADFIDHYDDKSELSSNDAVASLLDAILCDADAFLQSLDDIPNPEDKLTQTSSAAGQCFLIYYIIPLIY